MKFLKQSTAAVISYGPFVDKTDGVTLETGLVTAIDHASTGIKLSKAGGALTIRSQAVTASSYDSYGNYLVTLSTTDTGTVGRLRVQFVEEATCLAVWEDFIVLPANVYDSLLGTDLLQVDVTQLLNTAWLTPAVAGTPDVNTKTITANAITASAVADGAIDAATFASGAITATAIATDALGAAELAADAVTEIGTGGTAASGGF